MKEYLEVMIEKLSDLIAIKSVKGEPTKEAPYGKETLEALEYVLELGKAYGMTAVNVDGRAGYLEYGEGERMVGVLLHLDVVPEQDGWLTEPYTLTRKDGYLYGRGISDDKGPAIAAFFALVDLINKGEIDGYRVRLIFGLDEEMGSSCMAHYVKSQELPSLGFVPDADFPVIYAEKGILNLDIVGPGSDALSLRAGDRPNVVPGKCYINKDGKDYVFEGKPAHGAAPFDGINAVSVALDEEESFTSDPFLNFFNQHLAHKHYGEGLNIEYKDETGKLTVNPGLVGINSDKSFVTINIRYPATMDFDSLVKNISDIASENGFTIENIDNNPPLYVEKDSFLVRTLLEVYREKTEDYSKPLAIGGGTYARTMPNLVAFGMNMPGDAQNAHQANESIKEKRLYEAAEIYRESIKRLGQGLIDQ